MMTAIKAARNLTKARMEFIGNGELTSNDHRDVIAAVRDMKVLKIMEFRQAAAEGRIDPDVARRIISVMKTDVLFCDTLIITDLSDPEDVKASLSLIVSVIVSSPDPECQKEYTSTLNDNEASLELVYSNIVEEVQKLARPQCC